MSKCKAFLIALLTLPILYNIAAAQDRKTTLEARITFFDEIITEKKYEGKYTSKGLALTFINNSDQDIFIPYFVPLIRNKQIPFRSIAIFLTYYKKDSLGYKELLKPERKDVPGVFANDIIGLSQLMNPFSRRNKAVNDKMMLDIMQSVKDERINKLLKDFDAMPIFIKAHKEFEYYLPMDLSPYVKLGSYKIAFEPLLIMPAKDEFPDTLTGYKKFYPSEIKCAPLYVHFEPLRREETESIVEQIKQMAPGIKVKTN